MLKLILNSSYIIITISFMLLYYLIGSFMTAIWIAKFFAIPDPRNYGSKNPGTTNIMRSQNRLAAILTFSGDILKGYIPVFISLHLGYGYKTAVIFGICALLGHIFPIFYNFKGGKGMATATGIMLAVSWKHTLLNSLFWLISYYLFRISGISSIISIFTGCLIFTLNSKYTNITQPLILMSLLIIYKHSSNIYALLFEKTKKKLLNT